MLRYCVYAIFACLLYPVWVLGQDCAAACDGPPSSTCGGMKCSAVWMYEMEEAKKTCGPSDLLCVARVYAPETSNVWGACSVTCGGGKRTVDMASGRSEVIDCNTHSCTPPKGICTSDLVFTMDASGSLSDTDWVKMQQSVMDIIHGLYFTETGVSDVWFGAVKFSNDADDILVLDPGNPYPSLDAIDSIIMTATKQGGQQALTNTYSGLVQMRAMMDASSRSVQQIGIVLTDGRANLPGGFTIAAQKLKQEAEDIINDNIEIFAIGFGNAIESQLQDLVGGKVGYWKMVADATSLHEITQEIIDMVCEEANPCKRCNYTQGQLWAEHPNCHLYIVCEPIGNGEYIPHTMTCGHRFWHQKWHTCVEFPPDGNEDCGDIVTYPPVSTILYECPYLPQPADAQYFYSVGAPDLVQHCAEGLEFIAGDVCTCIVVDEVKPACSDDLLLHFPFDDHLHDVTCHQAYTLISGDAGDISIVYDAKRKGKVVKFDGKGYLEVAFIRTWFANNKEREFSISFWFKSDIDGGPVGLVNNGDCEDFSSFAADIAQGGVRGSVGTEVTGQTILPIVSIELHKWYNVVWVYNGAKIKLYLNKLDEPFSDVPDARADATGYMLNPDVPMYIGFLNDKIYKGFIDDIRVYQRVLSESDISDLFHGII